jgi:FkbM family methyltransferase
MSLKHELRRLLWKLGYDLSRFDPQDSALARRRQLLRSYGIDTVLDVGANLGQFAMQLRHDLGFAGKIVSFEPLSSAFRFLEATARVDPRWRVINCALGDTEATLEINVAENSYSSSFLDILPMHLDAAPESKYTQRESTTVKTLDSMIDDVCSTSDNVYLKIDTQGFESNVIRGAEKSLPRIGTIQLEMSLVPLYRGGVLFADMHRVLNDKHYDLVSIEPGFADRKSGRMLQVEGIYHRF